MSDDLSKSGRTVGHAEYKIPNGKLVVVDLQIDEGYIQHVQLSGDFFMEPPQALDQINQELIGLKANATTQQIEDIVTKVVQGEVMMYGITPNGIATVIQRALA